MADGEWRRRPPETKFRGLGAPDPNNRPRSSGPGFGVLFQGVGPAQALEAVEVGVVALQFGLVPDGEGREVGVGEEVDVGQDHRPNFVSRWVSTSMPSNEAKSSGLFVRRRDRPCAFIVATMFASWMRLPSN